MIGLWLSKPESSEQRVTLKIDANIKLIRMKHDQQLIDFVERHLRGELSPEELAEFDQLCVEDQEVKNIVIEHQSFIQHLTLYGARKRLVSDMEEAYQQFKVGGIVKQREKTFTIKKLWHTYRSHITVAASVALFAVITTWTLMRHFSDSGSTSYSILRREVNSLKQSQNALIRNINGKPVNKPEDSGRFRGTGFAISTNGYVITNYHVVQGADSIQVQNEEGQSFKVKQIYVDPVCDLAVLQISDPHFKTFTVLPYSFKRSLSDIGEDVFTIGFPDDKSVYGRGYLSSRTGYAGDTLAYQVSIPVNPGNSGGPLLDSHGNIIGIISGKQTHFDGAAFAIKSKFLLKSIEAISQDSPDKKLVLTKRNMLAGLDRKDQIKKLQNYIFMVKVY
jgi:S1-C subfamily serine protease